jgi:hypothetical protein
MSESAAAAGAAAAAAENTPTPQKAAKHPGVFSAVVFDT